MRSEIRKLLYLNLYSIFDAIGKSYDNNNLHSKTEAQSTLQKLWFDKELETFLYFWAGTKAPVKCHE